MGCNCRASAKQTNEIKQLFVFSKFGTCRYCINISMIGTIMNWFVALFIYYMSDSYCLKLLGTIPAFVFSFWLVLHFFGYMIQLKKARKNT